MTEFKIDISDSLLARLQIKASFEGVDIQEMLIRFITYYCTNDPRIALIHDEVLPDYMRRDKRFRYLRTIIEKQRQNSHYIEELNKQYYNDTSIIEEKMPWNRFGNEPNEEEDIFPFDILDFLEEEDPI